MKAEHMVPTIYLRSWDFRVLCRLFDAEFDLLKYYTDHILDCYSPQHCPRNLLPELAEHIGFDYNEFKSVMYNRVVLKHFIRNMIRYRGSARGIGNAAAVDIRYRQTYPEEHFDPETGTWVEDELAGQQVPMDYNEGIPIEKTWIDVDNPRGIIYLFIIAEHYFPQLPEHATPEDQQAIFEERMRRLLDLAYLQEYVRPVGMYLLPMVAHKVNPKTDLTVKAIRIPPVERNRRNGVTGTPNTSMEHEYDRMLFAKVENPGDDKSMEPWIRTLYHSQLAGNLNHQYFTKPVYHIEGKFLYYDHDELMTIYQNIMNSPAGTLGMKVGDSLYNPNLTSGPQDFSYGPDPANEPRSLQEEGKALYTTEPLAYDDYGIFDSISRTYQDIPFPELEPLPANDYPVYLYAGVANVFFGPDDGTNKNLIFNLFTVDSDDESSWTGAWDVRIAGKGPVDRNPVPYIILSNDKPVGTNVHIEVENSEGPVDPKQFP